MSKKSLTGVNVQWPISELIINGDKTIETRTYPLPEKYLGEKLVLIETPGPKGKFKARARAIIRFTESFLYKDSEDFYLDMDRHCVGPDSPWKWTDKKPKWGWKVEVLEVLNSPTLIDKKKGIIFTKDVTI